MSDTVNHAYDNKTDYSVMLCPILVGREIKRWLKEDIPSFDFAALAVGQNVEQAVILCKSSGVLAGTPFIDILFSHLNCSVNWTVKEGAVVIRGTSVATVSGPVNKLLQGERLALNILSRASGIATAARALCQLAISEKWHGEIAGTRKTTPGFRMVEKYALLVGGASQHRYDLSSMVMLKDNHVWSAGSVSKAIYEVRKACGFSSRMEVECRSYEDALEAAVAGVDVVMLDNFEPETAKSTAWELKKSFPHLKIEVSGGIRQDNISAYFSPNIDILSLSVLTQGYDCLDFSMKILKEGHNPSNPLVKFSLASSDVLDICSHLNNQVDSQIEDEI